MDWILMAEKPLQQGDAMEVVAFHPDWVDPDFNPNGTRVGFINGDDKFYSAKWCDYHDVYENDESIMPTHYMFMPIRPNI